MKCFKRVSVIAVLEIADFVLDCFKRFFNVRNFSWKPVQPDLKLEIDLASCSGVVVKGCNKNLANELS